jgi:type II secretion system protein C
MEALFKQYFWVVKGLGLAITAALAASVITTYIGTSYIYGERDEATAQGEGDTEGADDDDDDDKPAASLLAGGGSRSSSSRPSAGDRSKLIQSLLAHNLFCPSCVQVEVPAAEDGTMVNPITGEAESITGGVQPGEVQSSLPLRLVATMESSDPKFSYATLRDEESGGAGPFWPGDNLRPTAVLVSVERSMVHLRNGGALEYIELGVEPPKGAARPVAAPTKKKLDEDAPKPAGAIEGAENAIKCDSENSCTIERAWLEGVLSNPASLAKQARVMPSVKDGETRGFKFYGIRPGSLPKLLNIKNGDLITSVNGTDLKSMDGAMSLYAKLRRANNLSVTIERKGETIMKEITIQ